MNITAEQIKRIESDWSSYAGSPVTCEVIGGTVYGFCSDELASLRIFKKYAFGPNSAVAKGRARAINSISRGFTFALDLEASV